MEELGAADMAERGHAVGAPAAPVPGGDYGTAAQHADWLAPMVTGEALGAFCLTEPSGGSDAAALRTLAR